MFKKTNIESLVIEVTRKCNLCCEHCLRGGSEGVNIQTNHIDALLSQVGSIGDITFTGGEPSLNVPAILDTLRICKERDIRVGSIYVVTNGKVYSQELVDAMNEWFEYCVCGYAGVDDFDDVEIDYIDEYLSEGGFGLAMSIDEFHDSPSTRAFYRYKGLPYYRTDKEHSFIDNRGNYHGLILEGNAADNFALDERNYNTPLSEYSYEFDVIENDDDEQFGVEMIYLNALGNIFPCCDMSYDTQDNVIGDVNIHNRTIYDIIMDEDVHYDYFNYESLVV